MKTIGYLGEIDELFGAPATTRSWNTNMFSTADSESPRAANNGFARRSAYSKPGKIIRSHGEPLEVRAEQWLSNYGQSGSEPKYFLESRASLRPRNVRNLPEIPSFK